MTLFIVAAPLVRGRVVCYGGYQLHPPRRRQPWVCMDVESKMMTTNTQVREVLYCERGKKPKTGNFKAFSGPPPLPGGALEWSKLIYCIFHTVSFHGQLLTHLRIEYIAIRQSNRDKAKLLEFFTAHSRQSIVKRILRSRSSIFLRLEFERDNEVTNTIHVTT